MKRFKQNLSNYKLATCDMGQLVPVQCIEVLPGDTMRFETSAFIRVSPMLAPVMHPVKIRFHHWFVPNRLVWDQWEDFITGGPENTNTDTVPTHTVPVGIQTGSLIDYLGIPPVEGLEINELPLRAYNLIWNEFYRDQDLQTEVPLGTNTVQRVSWKKDYFTTARPWAQKGDQIYLPIGDQAPISGSLAGGVPTYDFGGVSSSLSNAAQAINATQTITGNHELAWSDPALDTSGLYADLTQATGITPNQFREYFALQRYQEARAQYGSRYTEYLRYLGITPSDARLQRPEYIGGGKSTIQFSEVIQTGSESTASEQVGQLRGHGVGATRTKPSRKFFEEHGHVLTLMSVVPDSIYQDGVHRNWLRQDKEDYFQKEFQSIGQQAIKQGEVYADPATAHNVFGYSDRYSEYCSQPSTIAAEFRDLLDYWHLARKFDTAPALNEDFIKCVPSKRIHAEQTQNTLWCMINNKTMSRRMVKKQSIGRVL